MTCEICGGSIEPWIEVPIDVKKNEATPFRSVHRCHRCGTATLMPKPTAEQVTSFYDLTSYYTHGQSHMPPVTPRLADKVLTKLAWWNDRGLPFDVAEFAERLPAGGRVLDIGCGHGALLAAFAERGHPVLGVEPDPQARQRASEFGLPVLAGTAEELPPEVVTGSFDLVVMSHSLEHCLNAVAAVRAAAACLAPGGHLYLEVPNCGCIHFRTLGPASENFDLPRHMWFFTPKALKRLVYDAGLRHVGWRYHGMTRHHAPAWRRWEVTIADRLRVHGAPRIMRHSLVRSAVMLMREAVAGRLRRYDAIGIVAQAGR